MSSEGVTKPRATIPKYRIPKKIIKMSIHHEVTTQTTYTTLEIYLQFMYAISALTLLLRSISLVGLKYGQFHKTITVNRKWLRVQGLHNASGGR